MNHLSPATPGTLRDRFIEDMTVRGFSEKTRRGYIRIVARFVAFLEHSPATATTEDIRRFQVQQSASGMGAPAMNSNVAALRFFFTFTLDRPDLARKLIRIPYNSCRNRHCPKCQGAAAREWLQAREADLLPVGYFHVVFTLPAEIDGPHGHQPATTSRPRTRP